MSYLIKIQLCDDDSVIEEIETEVTDREQGGKCIVQLAAALDDFIINSPRDDSDLCGRLAKGDPDSI